MRRHTFLRGGTAFLLALPALALAQAAAPARPTPQQAAHSLVSAFMAYTDLRIASIQRSLEILAATKEVRTGRWPSMKPLLSGYQRAEEGFIVWYVRPDGSYYTVDQGLMKQSLSDRPYFPDLMAGRMVTGALVISRSTGQRSAVMAVPIRQGGQVVGAVGASLFLDRFADQVSTALALPTDMSFFALAPSGLTTVHRKTDRHFVDPRELGSETLRKAANEMLSGDAGTVRYEFDNTTKEAVFRTSSLTGWKFAISQNAPSRE